MAKVFLPGVDPESRKRWRLADDDPGPVSLPKMLFKEDEARRLDRVGQPPKSSTPAFPALPPRQEKAPSIEPAIVRWAGEQRERQALRKQFPGYVPPAGPKGPPKSAYPAVLPERVKAFLYEQEPSVDWSRVVTRIGGNRPSSTSSTDHNVVSFSKPFKDDPVEFFHEMGHIPDWLDGSLTTPKYIGQALLSAARNATKNASTYGMFASREAPADPGYAIWEDI